MSELNPHNPLVQKVHDQWHKFCAVLMCKQGVREVRIGIYDIEKLAKKFEPDAPVVVIHIENAHTANEEIVLTLTDMTTAKKQMKRFEDGHN